MRKKLAKEWTFTAIAYDQENYGLYALDSLGRIWIKSTNLETGVDYWDHEGFIPTNQEEYKFQLEAAGL